MDKSLLIIGYVWPEPKSSAAGIRIMQLIQTFLNDGFSITFATSCAKSDNAFDLKSIGVNIAEIELNNPSFDDFIKDLNPDIVLFDRFMMEEQFGWRVAEQCPDALRILDTEDLHCLRRGRQKAYKDNKEFDESYLFNETAKREIASIYRCDKSLIISEAEMEILKHKFGVDSSLLHYLPFMLDEVSKEQQENLPKFEERNYFVTIGNFLHDPNYNAVLYLKQTIWPMIKNKIPNAEMRVYGSYTSAKVEQLQNIKEGFLIKGFTEDVNIIMQQAKVCLAPIRFGAGLKGKLIDAMLNGTPCVTTTIGAEGIFGRNEPNGFVADNAQNFVDNAIELYNNKSIWDNKQKNGFQIINQRFNKTETQKQFLNQIKYLQLNLKQHRLQNFTGSMLYHQSLQSTKYLSKWIEEKNKKST